MEQERIRQLRLALKEKLDERRRLLCENAGLRSDLARTRRENDFLKEALKSPLFEALVADMADEIADAVISQALDAAQIVAFETADERGSWEVGISVPALSIRRKLFREDTREVASSREPIAEVVRRLEVSQR